MTMHLHTLLGAAIVFILNAALLRAEDWPQWGGPNRNNLSPEKGLLKSWPASGPKRVWLYKNAGDGYSSPAIVSGKLFTVGTRDDREILIALNVADGSELWNTPIGTVRRDERGHGPRGTPTVDGDRVYGLSGRGELICAQVADGKVLWKKSMSELGGSAPNWGYSESVLIDGDNVLCTPGGSKGAIAALDKQTGALHWQTSDFKDPAHYSSIISITHNGSPQYVQLTGKSVVGVAPTDGKVLWRTDFPGRVAVVPTPIYSEGFVYVTAGYGVGCKLVKLGANNEVNTVYENRVMVNHHGGVVLVDGHVYGFSDSGGWLCQDFKTGEKVWSSTKLGKGAVTFADGMLYCVDENSGTVALVEASPKQWTEKSRFTPEPRTSIHTRDNKVWTHPVISNGKLYLRDQDLIHCYEIKG
jgi:outer membrane protein assembly factor BamB